MSEPEWRFCEVCGSAMGWAEEVGKFNPVTGIKEMHWYYQCSVVPEHMPKATEPGTWLTWIDRGRVVLRVPARHV